MKILSVTVSKVNPGNDLKTLSPFAKLQVRSMDINVYCILMMI